MDADYENSYIEEEESMPVLNIVYYVFANYGWHILIAVVVLYIIYIKKLKAYVEQYRKHKFEKEYAAKYHKNPDIFAAHVNAQQAWAEKMQEKYNRESEQQLQKLKEKEEKKRQQLIEKYGHEGGHVLGGNTQDAASNSSKNFKPDYNPLMGSGSSSSYRPPRRSPCGGGGCGR